MNRALPLPDAAVDLGGRPLAAGELSDVVSLLVEEDLDALSMATLVLRNWDRQRLAPTWSDDDRVAVGTALAVRMGYRDATRPVFSGEITGLEFAVAADGLATATVRAHDHGHRLTRARRTRTFVAASDGDIAAQIAATAGLTADAADGPPLEYVVQANQTDLEFLARRAALLGHEVYVRDEVLHFGPPRSDAAPVATLRLGTDLDEFTARSSVLASAGTAEVRGWDSAARQPIVASAAASGVVRMGGRRPGPVEADHAFGTATRATVDQPVQSRAEADVRASGAVSAAALDHVRADGAGRGNPALRAGAVVDVTGAGTRFSGPYYLTSVTHELTPDQGYRTTTEMRRNAT